MAKRSQRGGGRKATSKSASRAPAADVEIVEESAGGGWETGVAIVTTIVLVIAILLVDAERGSLGTGTFF